MYPSGVGLERTEMTTLVATRADRGATSVWLAGVLAVLLAVGAGIAYRVGAAGLRTALNDPIELPVPLSEIPTRINGWVGEELELPESIRKYMEANFADDYVRRQYVRATGGSWASVYVVYCASRPGGLLGHRPRVCFPANGWIHDETVPSQIVLRSGREIRCLRHQFHKAAPSYRQICVLSFYVLNGQITLDEDEFSGFFGRRPNISGDPARYVAQVQISSVLEHSARTAASDMLDKILAFLPDQNGRVQATHSTDGLTTEVQPGQSF